jgi:alkylation response protein AidB-like acyl-CoA dehydrogenase
MELSWTDEQQLLAQTVRDVCAKHSTPEIVRALEDDPVGFREQLWSELGSLGLLGLGIPEELGGAGASMLEQAIVCEELGRSLAPTPFIPSSVMAAAAIRIGGNDAQRAALLRGIAAGSEIVAPAWFEHEGREAPGALQTRLEGGTVTGIKVLVPYASSATRLLVVGSGEDGVRVVLVDPVGPGVRVTQERTMASDAAYEVTFDAAPAEPLGGGRWEIWEAALNEALVAVAAYAVGGASRAHELAVEYAKDREQFGRKIGSFQGIAHPLADTATDIEGARVLVWQAAWAHATGARDAATLSAMAKLYACDAFKRTTKVGQQTFGGIGFIRDVDMQLYFRRAKQMELLWLGPRALEERIAAAELDAPTPFVGIDAGM